MSISSNCRASRLFCLVVLLFAPHFAAAAPEATAREVRTDVGGYKLNSVMIEPAGAGDLPPIVFLHGASANLHDPLFSFEEKLKGRARLLFVDRPGHGSSDAGGDENIVPDGQADAIARLMDKRGIRRAVIVGHSFGGAIAAAFAVRHPEKVVGLVLLSPAVYSWPGGVAWYYDAARAPVTGQVFSTLIAPTVGALALDRATAAVFAPNKRPSGYIRGAKIYQALNPMSFRHNAHEVAALNDWARNASPAYRRIRTPTIIITGDADRIVSPDSHARQLARNVRGSELIVVHNLGHKSDYVANDVAILLRSKE